MIKVFPHIDIEVFEHQVQFVRPVNDVDEADDVLVVKFFEQSHFSESCAWDSFVAVFDLDFFEGNNLNDSVRFRSNLLLDKKSKKFKDIKE